MRTARFLRQIPGATGEQTNGTSGLSEQPDGLAAVIAISPLINRPQ
jgi:hypothetical protein